MALTRFNGSIGFIADPGGKSDDNYLLTIYIPDSNPDGSILDVNLAHHQGFFAQFAKADLKGLTEEEIKQVICMAKKQHDEFKNYAFALFEYRNTILNPLFVVYRRPNWMQEKGEKRYTFEHLHRLDLFMRGDGEITLSQAQTSLQLGKATLSNDVSSFSVACQPAIDLVTGQMTLTFSADQTFFTSFPALQAIHYAELTTYPGNKEIESTPFFVSLFDNTSTTEISLQLRAELDLYPHWNNCTGSELTSIYLKRTRISAATQENTNQQSCLLYLNSRDTLGRKLTTTLGRKGERDYGQHLCFLPIYVYIHTKEDPDKYEIKEGSFKTILIPQGIFPIEPAYGPGITAERRMKFGPSNTEVLQIREIGGRPNLALEFIVNPAQGPGQQLSTSPPTGGLLRRSLADVAEDLKLGEEIVKKYRTGPVLSSISDTVWMRFRQLDASGGVRDLFDDSVPGSCMPIYSVQPDKIALYNTKSLYATKNESLGYTLEPVALGEAPVPMSFFEGHPSDNPPISLGALAQALSDHRLWLRKSSNQSIQQFYPQRTPDPNQINRLLDEIEASITPQGFEVKVAPNSRQYVLARSGNSKVDLIVSDHNLSILFQKDSYFFVFPAIKGISITGEVEIGSWPFNLNLGEPSPRSSGAQEENSPPTPVVVLKFMQGSLRDLLSRPSSWSNTIAKNLETKLENDLNKWLDTIAENIDKPAFSLISKVVNDPGWAGVLFIYPSININSLPDELKSLVAGIDIAEFRGHHLGFPQNKISFHDGCPKIDNSSFFGLVDYNWSVNPTSDKNKFNFVVKSLQVLFNNSEVKDFNCDLDITIPNWLDDNVTTINDKPGNSFLIKGRYQATRDANNQKVVRYSFANESPIKLKIDSKVCKEVCINRVELRLKSSTDSSFVTEVVLDAVAKFSNENVPANLLEIDQFELSGISIPITNTKVNGKWEKNVRSLNFDGLAIGEQKYKKDKTPQLPIKFRRIRFFTSQKSLQEFGFSSLGNSNSQFKYGMEWDVDFGGLAKMLGLDSKLKGSLLVGWNPNTQGDICLGIRFDDMGGDKLDIGIGSLLRLKANIFSFGKFKRNSTDNNEQPYILASDVKVILFGDAFPKDSHFGLVLIPNPVDPLHGPLGWLTTVKSDKPIGPVKDLKVAIGQNLKYTGDKTTPKEIIGDVGKLADFQVSNDDNGPKIKDDLIKTFLEKLQYYTGNDWFLAFSGGTSSGITGCAVYNPPSLLGGQVGTTNLEISLLYRQETPRLGTYTGTLLLSEKIGSIDAGPIKIQLHKIEVKADTDGGYSINIGLNEAKPDDFSKAAGAEVGVYKGDVALLIANINGAAIQRIPKYKNTVIYTPASRIMMAGRFGLGRSFKKGILSAQASITFYGTFEGLIAERDLSNVPNAPNQPDPKKLPSQYFLIQAEVGIIAEVQGVVDFGVMRSRLDARLQIGFGCVLEMWKGADVYLRADLRIDLHFEITPKKKLPFGIVIPAIKIHLKFTTSYEEKYKLVEDKSKEYQQYFGTGMQALPEEVTTSQLRDMPDWSTTPDVSQKITIPLYLTLDSTLNDNLEAILVPLVVVPWSQSNSFHRDQSSRSPFQEIASFIFEWSLNALFQQPPETISRADLLECERRVASAKTIWAGDFAWKIFLRKFAFQLSIPPKPDHQEAKQTLSGTIFVLPGTFDVTITYQDTNKESERLLLGDKEVNPTYLQELDEFFDKLRMSFEDRKDTLLPEATSERLLLLFLYEEYLTSLLRSIWMSLVANINGDQSPNFTVNYLKETLWKEMDSISGLVNRQIFSGARVPVLSADILKPKTQSLWEAANLTLRAELIESAKSLTINATALGPDTAPVIFQAREGSVPGPLNSELDRPPTAPRIVITSFKQLQPFDLTSIRHPLFESIPIKDKKVLMWHLPMPLCLKSEKCEVSGKVIVKLLSLKNEPSNSTILRIPDNPENTIPFTPYALISAPLSIEGRALVLQAMKESDRRLLRKVGKNINNKCMIRFFIEEIVDGQISSFRELADAKNCWLARVNLSTDPNPTTNQLLFFPDSTELFADQATNIKSFLELLQLAAETNSGGYFFYNDSWDISAQRIVVAIGFPQESTSAQGGDYRLPAYINWIEAAAPDSNHVYLLEEKDSIPVPVGHPGVLSAELIRPHPQTTYRDPSRPNSPRTLHREQALAILEYMNHGHCSGILRKQDRLGFLPDDVLADASVDEVHLDSRFSLLEMAIINDGEFEELSGEIDLPSPPCQKDYKENSDLIYHWSIPAYKRVNKSENDLLPKQPDKFIYGNIGQTLTISAGFRDVLGFRPKRLDTDPKNLLPLKSYYFDPLIRWSELEGMKVNHYLDQREMKLVVQLHFTPSTPDGEVLITDKMSPYLLAMQQIRDRNVEFAIRSSLQTHVLTDNDRKELYKFLQSCPSLKTDKSFPIEVPLTALEPTPQVADVYFAHIQICRTNKNLIWKELQEGPAYKATLDLPIGNLITDFASSLETIYEKMTKDRVCIGTTHDSLGAVKLYILKRALLDLPQPKRLAFAALKPISTNPYAKAKARIWDGEFPIDDPNNRKEKEIDIVDFDQDEALNSYLQDLDLLLTPKNSIELLKEQALLSQLLCIKGGLANWAAERAAAIYDDDEQQQVVKNSSQNLKDNLSNSFKKRLARITDVDTIIVAPFNFEQKVEKQLLLYGRIQKNETSLTTIRPKIEANLLKHLRKHKIRTIEGLLRFPKEELYALMPVPESPGLTAQSLDTLLSLALEKQGPSSECFLPTALERGNNTSEGTLVIQLDVRNPASLEILEADLEFSIEHIRLSLGNDEPIWLELVSPIPVKLGEAKIPILYKKLLRKPDISLAPPIPSQDRVEEGLPIAKNLEWSLTFDVERTRAAIQDTVKIDILYNFCSKDKTPLLREGQDLGEVLYEYLASRSIAQQNQRLPQALRYWGQLILEKLSGQSLQLVESIGKLPQEKLEIYEQYVQAGGNNLLQINLVREPTSDPDLFATLSYKIEGIYSSKSLLDSNFSPVLLPTEGKLASCTIEIPDSNEYGEYYSGRRISIGKLNVFQFENAWPAVSIKRNQKILSKSVNNPFVYSTELMRLGESYMPMIIHEHVVELNKTEASLHRALLKFLQDVFLYFKSPTEALKLPDFEMAWGFDSGQLAPYREKDDGMRIYDADPIGMFPPKSANYNDLEDQIKVVMGSLEKWEKENTNSTRPQNGRYVFKLRVYSRFSQLEKPILVFNNLSYSF